jgi:FdhD protein
VPAPAPRLTVTTAACGVCGTAALADVRRRARWPVEADGTTVAPAVLHTLTQRLRQSQEVFARTGGVHAAALASPAGELLCVREDVGRHNAVDKVIGWAVRHDRLPLTGTVLLVSGRASYELVQKAWVAGIPVLAAVSAPSSLAVDLAREAGLTLVGFLRDDGFNGYSRPDRLLT